MARGLEILAAFLVGVAVMSFIYVDSRGNIPYDRIGIPEYDSWYHVKMAALMPEVGLVDTFPWLRFVYFTPDGKFVNHHYLFQLILSPFVRISQQLTGDYAPGARWFNCICFGMVGSLFFAILRSNGVRWRWLWLLIFLHCAPEFFLRHSYIRAICPSLISILLILLLMFQRRLILTALAIVFYIHVYLGGVMYVPILVGAFVAALLLSDANDRRFAWKLAVCGAAAWLVGVLAHPYRDGIPYFLKLQVFGTGLAPDIDVGNEWYSYGEVWYFFTEHAGIPLLALVAALLVRLGMRVPAGPKDLALLVIAIAFWVLTFKAKRFIEYSPIFSVLSAAFLASPLINRVAAWFSDRLDSRSTRQVILRTAIVLLVAGGAVAWAIPHRDDGGNSRLTREWPIIALLVQSCILPATLLIWLRCASGISGVANAAIPIAAIPLTGAVTKWMIESIYRVSFSAAPTGGEIYAGPLVVFAVGGAYVAGMALVAVACIRRKPADSSRNAPPRIAPFLGANVQLVGAAAAFAALLVGWTGPTLTRAQEISFCGFDLPAIRSTMKFVEQNSKPGDVIFTDDWDIFPIFFYFNSHNNYIVGLDPKFTQSADPVLWERFVRISRGEIPHRSTVVRHDKNGDTQAEVDVELDDIRREFHAGFVVTDRNHRDPARRLMAAPGLAEFIYPLDSSDSDPPYLVFRIRTLQVNEERSATTTSPTN